jgi:hypothetical protein
MLLSSQLVGQAGAGNQADKSQCKARRNGQIMGESRQATSTEPGSRPDRNHYTTHSQIMGFMLFRAA